MLKEKLQSIFDHALICDACLGRQFAKLLTQTTNEERGKALRMSYALWLDSNEDSKKEKPSEHILTQNMSNYTFKNNKHLSCPTNNKAKETPKCLICNGLFEKESMEKLIEQVKYYINGIDFDTFSMGAHLSDELFKQEESLWEETGIDYCEAIKTHLNRNIGTLLRRELNKQVNLKDPDLSILVDFSTKQIKTKTKALYVKGYCSKFRKMALLKQVCYLCYGLGCRKCDYIGKPEKSVHEFIERHLLVKTLGIESKFHTIGFESADFLFSGKRPFVIEIKNPKKRVFDLKKIEEKINKNKELSVCKLEFTTREDMIKLKSRGYERVYDIKITLKDKKNIDKIKSILEKNKIHVLKEKSSANKLELKTTGYSRQLNDGELIDDIMVNITEFKPKRA
ncbi:MAG: hypothetical protein KAR87_01060 [Candidatus Aenigmarchaeota archaeon]|nr:hypothetical protein [Candidatus Aenigmarchaeota archaeon]